MSENIRTVKVKIDIPLAVAERTVAAWTDACNTISGVAFGYDCLSNAIRLHKLTYQDVRHKFNLSAQVAASAIRHVASKYASARTDKRIPQRQIHFRKQAVALQGGPRGRDFSFTRAGLSVTTIDGRLKSIAYHGPPQLTAYLADWQMGDARLFVRKGKVFLSISFKQTQPEIERPNDAVVGVDRGINNLAVITDGKRTRFFGGGHTRTVRTRYVKTRASLQAKKAQRNTRSVRRALQRLSGRQARFMRNENHSISKGIVTFASLTGNPTIAIEALDGIRANRQRKPQRTELNRWAFYQLEQFITYKAANLGFAVIEVEARNTSKGCSRCGYTDATNRNRHDFTCKACGYRTHADRNAALNIRLRGILSRQELVQDGPPSIGPSPDYGRAEARVSVVLETTGKPPSLDGGD